MSVALRASVRTQYGNHDTVLADAHIPDRDFTPIENPEDDPYGKGCYGYNTLRLLFNDNQAIRAANKAVAEYKKRKAERPKKKQRAKDHLSIARPVAPQNPPLLLPPKKTTQYLPITGPKVHGAPPQKFHRNRQTLRRPGPSLVCPSRTPPKPPCRGGFQTRPRPRTPLNRARVRIPRKPGPRPVQVPQIIRRQGPAQEKTRENLRRPAGRRPAPMSGPRRLPKRDCQHPGNRRFLTGS